MHGTKRILIPAAAIACLSVLPARADWSLQKTFTCRPGQRNISVMAFPGSVGLQDVAGAQGGADRCANGPDGVIDMNDAVCTLYSSRPVGSSLTLAYVDVDSCTFVTTRAVNTSVLGLALQGASAPIDPSRGYLVNLSAPGSACAQPVLQGGLLAGPCQPRMPARTIEPSRCTMDIIPNPPDSRLRSADEILCGERNVDWRDDDADGRPDTCPNGLFDGTHRLYIWSWSEDPAAQTMPLVRLVEWNRVTGLVFLGRDFSVPPGAGALLRMTTRQEPRTWDPPVDPLACR